MHNPHIYVLYNLMLGMHKKNVKVSKSEKLFILFNILLKSNNEKSKNDFIWHI